MTSYFRNFFKCGQNVYKRIKLNRNILQQFIVINYFVIIISNS